MLRRFRIEVEEETAEQCVEALWKYEHALMQQEVRRYRDGWPVTLAAAEQTGQRGEPLEEMEAHTAEEEYPTPDQPWSDGVGSRQRYDEQLGRELHEEVIEFDEGIPGYRGRRVVSLTRIDTRHAMFLDSLTFSSVVAPIQTGVSVPGHVSIRDGS